MMFILIILETLFMHEYRLWQTAIDVYFLFFRLFPVFFYSDIVFHSMAEQI